MSLIISRHWRQLAAQPASWYATPSGAVGRQFTAILAEERRGVLSRIWNSKRPLLFAHIVLRKTLGVRRAREIRVRTNHCINLCERGQHAGLVGDAEAEGLPERAGLPLAARRRTRLSQGATMARYCKVRYVRLSFEQPTERGEGVPSQMTNAQKTGDRLQRSSGRSTPTCVPPPWKTPRVQPARSFRKYPKQYP